MFHAGSRILPLALALLCLPCFQVQPQAGPDKPKSAVLISNRSRSDLVGVRFVQPQGVSLSKLDLAPGMEEELENPGGEAELRLDLGLELCTYRKVALDGLKTLTLCPDHRGCIVLKGEAGAPAHLAGECASLLPQPGETPVCALDKFRPGMTMRDACGLISAAYRADDSAYVTSLGYAGLVWSARLYAGGSQAGGDATSERLEDIELRQTLTPEHLAAVRAELARQDFVPWQATLPGMEIDFADMGYAGPGDREALLKACLDLFLKSGKGEASVMFAPRALLPELATADAPREDVYLFTLMLRRDSGTLLLDMAAYTGEEPRD